ncbi:MAG: hypothetical protein JWO80_5519 [Bryobacterales bacterium]|nr:hypothetical protein [Bryobacterales bacterium]
MNSGYVLDSFAVMAWLKTPSPRLPMSAKFLWAITFVSAINAGEVAYALRKRFRAGDAKGIHARDYKV